MQSIGLFPILSSRAVFGEEATDGRGLAVLGGELEDEDGADEGRHGDNGSFLKFNMSA